MAFTSWNIGQYVYCNCLLTRLWHHKFWTYLILIFLLKPIFLHDQKVKTNISISWEQKELLRWKKKLFITFKGLSLKQIKDFFRRWEPYFKHDESYLLTVPKLEHQSCFWQLVTALYHSCVKLMRSSQIWHMKYWLLLNYLK